MKASFWKGLEAAGFNGDYRGHAFGREGTVEEIVRRIAWEFEAEGIARKAGDNATADAHALTIVAYTNLLTRKEPLK